MYKVILILILTTQLSLAGETPCDGIISSCQETVESYRVLVTDQDKLILNLTKQRNELATKPDGMPFYFWLLVGAAGATLAIGVRR